MKLNETKFRIMDILQKRQAGLVQNSLIHKIGKGRGWTQKNINELIKFGLVSSYGMNPKIYMISDKGRRFLVLGGVALSDGNRFCGETDSGSMGQLSQKRGQYVKNSEGLPLVRSHGIQLTIPIIQKPENWGKSYKNKFVRISDELKMHNWDSEVRARWHGNYMLISPASIVFYVRELWASDVDINFFRVILQGTAFCRDMERIHPGLKLGEIRKGSVMRISKQEHAMGLASKDIESCEGRTFVIDWSKGFPEIEFKDSIESGDHMSRFKEFIDSVAEGSISLGDIRVVRDLKAREERKKDIIRTGVLYSKFLWGKMEYKHKMIEAEFNARVKALKEDAEFFGSPEWIKQHKAKNEIE